MKHSFYLVLGLTFALAACRVSADPAGDFLHQAASAHLLTGASAADALRQPGAFGGQVLETSATVSGIVSAGDDKTALLNTTGAAAGQSIALSIPKGLRGASWLDSGAQVRLLLEAVPDDPNLPAGLRLLAVAPEGDVVAAETQAAKLLSARLLSRRQSFLASRSLPAGRSSRRTTYTAYIADTNPGHPAGALSARALSIYGPYRSLVRRWNRRLSDGDVDKITTSILYFSDINNLDPRLPVAMIIAESDFDLYSTSRTGAMGLSQLMPSTARGLGVTNAYDPIQNIGAAVHILRGHLDSYGGAPANAGIIPFSQIALTMAAYNAGPGAVRKYHGVPPYRETQRYIQRVASLYRQMCGASAPQEASAK
ncbi:MAG: lytic transglycosylase domain-containing protein [Janthinobacterium lividum]